MNQEFARQVQTVVENIRQVVVASPDVVKMSLLGLLCQGHVLLDDFPPGVTFASVLTPAIGSISLGPLSVPVWVGEHQPADTVIFPHVSSYELCPPIFRDKSSFVELRIRLSETISSGLTYSPR